MAEYKSFHYLMHQVPDAVKPVYVSGPAPLTFPELYSPRSERRAFYKGEKSFWRTRDRIEFNMHEDRSSNVVIVTCRNLDKPELYRTIFLSLAALCFEVESKAQGNRDPLVRKKDKKLNTDEALHKAMAEYVLARLNIGAEPLQWPDFSVNSDKTETNNNDDNENDSLKESQSTAGPVERMCTFSKLANDVFDVMEIDRPAKLCLDNIEHVRLRPADVTPDAVGSAVSDALGTGEGSAMEAAGRSSAEDGTAGAGAAPAPTTAGPGSTTPAPTVKSRSTIVAKVTGSAPCASAGTDGGNLNTVADAAAAPISSRRPTAKPAAGKLPGTAMLKNNKVVPV